MTLTWRTLRDYALRIATKLAVAILAVVVGAIPLIVTTAVLRNFFLSFTLAHAETISVVLFFAWLAEVIALAIVGEKWRKDWLWRRWWIDVGH